MKRKKIILLVLVILLLSLLLVPMLSGCNNNVRVLKIYNADDYIDGDILDEFVAEHNEKNPKDKIIIQYDTFDTLERAYTIINKREADYDLVCPSDYIIEKMKKNNLLAELDKSKIPNLSNIPEFLLDRNFDRGNTYSVPYMWGTVGIMYNADKVDESDLGGWDLLWNEKYKNKILMKDSIRDSVFIATIYAYREELQKYAIGTEEYRNKIDDLVNNISEEKIKIVEQELREQYKILYAYEVDSGKDSMINGEAYVNLAWSGDAVWAIEEAANPEKKNPINLDYYIPEEGSNIWFDNWVIPKFGKNYDLAHEFINYICRPDIALRNMEECGYTTAVMSPDILDYLIDEDAEPQDFTYLFEGNTQAIDYYLSEGYDLTSLQIAEISIPSKEKAANLVEMTDFGEKQDIVVKMWTRVKALPLGIEVIIFSICLLIAIVALIAYSIYKKIEKKKLVAGKVGDVVPVTKNIGVYFSIFSDKVKDFAKKCKPKKKDTPNNLVSDNDSQTSIDIANSTTKTAHETSQNIIEKDESNIAENTTNDMTDK